MSDLTELGWDDARAEQFEPHAAADLIPGRVAVQHRGAYDVLTEHGELRCDVAGRLYDDASSPAELPAVGDWVAVAARPDEQSGTVQAVLPRRTKFSRKTAWQAAEEQVLAANVDVVLIVTSLNEDLNLRRLERYLTLAWESGARPIFVLTKADLADDVAAAVAEVESIAFGVPVVPISNVTGAGLDDAPLAARAGHHRRVARLVRRREVDARQHAPRRGAARDEGDPRRRQGAPHDDPPGAHRSSRGARS